jgi:hypothetical protein
MLQSGSVMHYLELRQTKTHITLELTTGFDKKFDLRLDTAFVLSPGLVSRWEEDVDGAAIINQTSWTYRRHTRQFASRRFSKKHLMRYSDVYILLIIRKREYKSDSVNLLRHSMNKERLWAIAAVFGTPSFLLSVALLLVARWQWRRQVIDYFPSALAVGNLQSEKMAAERHVPVSSINAACKDTQVSAEDLKLIPPFRLMVTGPSSSGKF